MKSLLTLTTILLSGAALPEPQIKTTDTPRHMKNSLSSYLIRIALLILIVGASPSVTSAQEELIHYDTLDDLGHRPVILNLPADAGGRDAQQFFTGDSDNVTSVTLGLGRQSAPGDHLRIEIWETAASGDPLKSVGVLGEIEVNSLTNYSNWPQGGSSLDEVTVEGMVSGLTPNSPYFLVIYYTVDDYNGPRFDWGYDTADAPDGNAPKDIVINSGNGWVRFADFVGVDANIFMRARISGTRQPLLDPFIIVTTGDGAVTKQPDLVEYPIGTEVTVTAAPEEGFEFVKWIYGDEEFTTNPVIITIEEGATLTPIFAEIEEPEPLQIDIEHAVAIGWDSQSGKTYQIHASTDMENWEVSIDNIEGTGERLTYCFIREETETYYRVEEKR